MEIKVVSLKYPSRMILKWNSQLAKASWRQKNRCHHLPYVTYIDTLYKVVGQALLMTSQSRSRTE